MNTTVEWLLLLIAASVSGLAGAYLGDGSGNRSAGFWFGFLLGPVGLFIADAIGSRGRPRNLDDEVRAVERDEHVRMKVRKEWRIADRLDTSP